MTLNAAQTTPATTIKDNNGNILWQFISNTFGNIATLISQKIVIYNSGLTHIRGYQLPDQNTTLVGLNTSNTLTNTNTFNKLLLTNGQFINAQNEIMAINYSAPSTTYVIFNATTNGVITSGSDAGLVLQKGINALSVTRGGTIFIHSGIYTATSQVIINKTLTLVGANYWIQGGTIWKENTGTSVDGIVIGNTASTLKGVTIQDMSFQRDHQHSAMHVMSFVNNTQHSVLERVSFWEHSSTMYSELKISGCDADFLDHVSFTRDSALAGNETDFAEFLSTFDFQITVTDAHFVGSGGTTTATYGWELNKDRGDKIENSEFDLMFTPIWILNGSPLSNLIVSTTGFFENYKNYPRVDSGATISGTWNNYGPPSPDNFTTNTHYMSLDSTNNYTDSTDFTKKFNWIISGITTKHRQSFTVPNANGTLSLQPIYNFTSPSNKTGTNSLTPVMYGGFATLTPRYSTNATISVSGYGYNTILNDGCYVSIQSSNANMGLNGAALAGTKLGSATRFVSPTANANETFNIEVTDTSLTVGTKQFYDLAFKAVTGGICKLVNVNWDIREQ